MIIKFAITILITFAYFNSASQVLAKADNCSSYGKENTEAFIQGYKDSINAADEPIKFINPAHLIKGFELHLADTTYKILHFHFTFVTDCCISELTSRGNRLEARNDSIIKFDNIVQADYITIDNIVISKNNNCYKTSPFIYYVKGR